MKAEEKDGLDKQSSCGTPSMGMYSRHLAIGPLVIGNIQLPGRMLKGPTLIPQTYTFSVL